jgi:hypothetical protein
LTSFHDANYLTTAPKHWNCLNDKINFNHDKYSSKKIIWEWVLDR